jgi:5S rRNA maturation endonuclease (ribonuclease M5)
MSKSVAAESALIESLSRFMKKLNDEDNSLVVVEGLRDAQALRDSGFVGDLFMLCHKSNIVSLEERAKDFAKIILLLDNDAEGKKLSERTQRILRGRVKVDTYYQRELLPAGRGRIRHVEELSSYASRLAVHL